MISDRPDRDVLPPREVGISAVHACYGSFDVHDRHCEVNDAREILSLLKKDD